MSLSPFHLQQVEQLPEDWELIPLSDDKGPMKVSGTEMRIAWKTRSWGRADFPSMNGDTHAVGVKCGVASGGLLILDFDALKDDPDSSKRCFKSTTGFDVSDLPITVGWTSGKPGRAALAFIVPMDYWEEMPNRKVWGENGIDLLEARFSDHYCAVIGAHPETAGYKFLQGRSPDLLQVSEAPEWLLEVITRKTESKPVEPSSEDAARAVEMLKCIDPAENQNYRCWLRVGIALHHTDEGLLDAWTEWSKQMDNFKSDDECLKKWLSFKPKEGGLSIGSLHEWAKAGGYKEPKAEPSGGAEGGSPLDDWDEVLKNLVDPNHPNFERNTIRRQIRAATSAAELNLRVSPIQVRSRLIQKQRSLLKKTEEKGVSGGQVASFAVQVWLINNLISADCLTSIAAFVKVGKTKCLTELVSSLIFQHPFMGNPEWMPSPEKHKFILWWTDQPGVNSAQYLKARGLMDADGRLHPQIVKLYTAEDNLCWDDEGMDELIEITTKHPGAILISDSFYANVRPVHGSDQEPEAGGALIDIQTYCADKTRAHICAFHSPQDRDKLGMEAIRGHGSAKGVPSGGISIHFIEKKDPRTNKWVADKETPYRRVVVEGRMPYQDLLVGFDGEAGTWNVIGKFEQSLAELQSTDGNDEVIGGLTTGQRETLEWVGSAAGVWKGPHGVTVRQVAACKVQNLEREPTDSEIEGTRKQLRACAREGLLTQKKVGREFYFSYRSNG